MILDRAPADADTLCRRALAFQSQGDLNSARHEYELALQLDDSRTDARLQLARLSALQGNSEETYRHWRQLLRQEPDALSRLEGLMSQSMQAWDLTAAGTHAVVLAQLRAGSRWYPRGLAQFWPTPDLNAQSISVDKLAHDIAQFQYLQRRGVLGQEFTRIIEDYQAVVARLQVRGILGRVMPDEDTQHLIGAVFNRIVHVRDTPRLPRALSGSWDANEAQSRYLNEPPGILILDDFLSSDALWSLRQFCLESTVWSSDRYAYGRLGAFFEAGFNCPLLLQIAEEIRAALPQVIGERYPLRQLWAFKYGPYLPADVSTHADFAAVNVNFWITPEEANLDANNSGGMVVWDVGAPLDWHFERYQNMEWNALNAFLQAHHARPMTIPYRQNRAVIFNSDLFHGTAAVNFRPEYEQRRINVTMLYGNREHDVHHPPARDSTRASPEGLGRAWRSRAWRRGGG